MVPKVNVIIANRNYGKWLGDAITSVAEQTYKNLFVTLVDDNSDDDSIEVAKKVVKEKGVEIAICCLDQTMGPSYCRNVAIENSINTTDIYAILDADDMMLPNKISRCVAELMQNPFIGVVYADYIIHNEETGQEHIEYKEPFSKTRLLQECIVHSGALITKQALIDTKDEFGYYDITMRTCEDYDLWTRISEKYMITHIAEPLTFVRAHNNNSTNSVDKAVWQQNWNRIAQKCRSRNGV